MTQVVCLMGPTASGKTRWVYEMARQFPLSVISVDSAMIYQGMNIGTAKPSRAELGEVPHALVDILNPTESYSVAQFCQDVAVEIKQACQAGKIPVCVGGTMMYFNALQRGLSNLPEVDLNVRKGIQARALQEGWPSMHRRLAEVDACIAKRLHPHDAQRIARALEVYEQTGKPLSSYQGKALASNFTFTNVILMPPSRAIIHERIAKRTRVMIKQGLEEEVAALLVRYQLNDQHASMRSVGYRQWFPYFAGECRLAEVEEAITVATRRLAKRQCTWLKQWPDALTLDPEGAQTKKQFELLFSSYCFK